MGTTRGRSAHRVDWTEMAKSLTARLSRACEPASIDDELAVLWREAGRDGPIAHALMANLVVFRDCPAKDRADLAAPIGGVPVGEVARRPPSPVIVPYHGHPGELPGPIGPPTPTRVFGQPPMR